MIVFLVMIILSGRPMAASFDTFEACQTARIEMVQHEGVDHASECLEVTLKPNTPTTHLSH